MRNRTFPELVEQNPFLFIGAALLVNLAGRIIIYYTTNLFWFSDYFFYLKAIDNIAEGNRQYLLDGNFLFLLSYIGYFFRDILGSLDYFFLFNAAAATASSLIMALLVMKISKSAFAGFLTVILHTFYTEFMVFSSIFYTPVLMILLLALLFMLFHKYISAETRPKQMFISVLIVLLFLLSFFFKPELRYMPFALLILGLATIRLYRKQAVRTIVLGLLLIAGYFSMQQSGIITSPPDNVISNSFVFYGHTDYGGDGGEGALIYEENRERYNAALSAYLERNGIANPGVSEINRFQREEMWGFIKANPFRWAALQVRKFFMTFGIMPESSTFRVLYTGSFKGKALLTAIALVFPVATIIAASIFFFNAGVIRRIFKTGNHTDTQLNRFLLLALAITFTYYLVATIFYGQYQERYRMPLMTLFIIPSLAIFISNFKPVFKATTTNLVKFTLLVVFALSWVLQANSLHKTAGRYESELMKLDEIERTLE